MRQNFNNNSGKAGGIAGRFAAQKKKSIVAVALVVMMVFMWVRVLKGKSPQAAQGAIMPSSSGSTAQQGPADLKILFVELPAVPGRHDVLLRDFFQMDGAMFGSAEHVNILSDEGGQAGVRRIAGMCRLDAIGMGAEPEAFINDRIVKTGDYIIVPDGEKKYECEVIRIEANVVTIKVEDTEVELKLKQPEEDS